MLLFSRYRCTLDGLSRKTCQSLPALEITLSGKDNRPNHIGMITILQLTKV